MNGATSSRMSEGISSRAKPHLLCLKRKNRGKGHRLRKIGIREARTLDQTLIQCLRLENAHTINRATLAETAVVASHGAGRCDTAGPSDLTGVKCPRVPRTGMGGEQRRISPD